MPIEPTIILDTFHGRYIKKNGLCYQYNCQTSDPVTEDNTGIDLYRSCLDCCATVSSFSSVSSSSVSSSSSRSSSSSISSISSNSSNSSNSSSSRSSYSSHSSSSSISSLSSSSTGQVEFNAYYSNLMGDPHYVFGTAGVAADPAIASFNVDDNWPGGELIWYTSYDGVDEVIIKYTNKDFVFTAGGKAISGISVTSSNINKTYTISNDNATTYVNGVPFTGIDTFTIGTSMQFNINAKTIDDSTNCICTGQNYSFFEISTQPLNGMYSLTEIGGALWYIWKKASTIGGNSAINNPSQAGIDGIGTFLAGFNGYSSRNQFESEFTTPSAVREIVSAVNISNVATKLNYLSTITGNVNFDWDPLASNPPVCPPPFELGWSTNYNMTFEDSGYAIGYDQFGGISLLYSLVGPNRIRVSRNFSNLYITGTSTVLKEISPYNDGPLLENKILENSTGIPSPSTTSGFDIEYTWRHKGGIYYQYPNTPLWKGNIKTGDGDFFFYQYYNNGTRVGGVQIISQINGSPAIRIHNGPIFNIANTVDEITIRFIGTRQDIYGYTTDIYIDNILVHTATIANFNFFNVNLRANDRKPWESPPNNTLDFEIDASLIFNHIYIHNDLVCTEVSSSSSGSSGSSFSSSSQSSSATVIQFNDVDTEFISDIIPSINNITYTPVDATIINLIESEDPITDTQNDTIESIMTVYSSSSNGASSTSSSSTTISSSSSSIGIIGSSVSSSSISSLSSNSVSSTSSDSSSSVSSSSVSSVSSSVSSSSSSISSRSSYSSVSSSISSDSSSSVTVSNNTLGLNGSNQYLNAGNDIDLVLTDNFLYNVWIYRTSLAQTAIFGRWQGAGLRALLLEILSDSTIAVTTSLNGTAIVVHISSFTIPINTWTMVSVRMTGGNIHLSKNAATEDSFAQTTIFAGSANTTFGAVLNPSAFEYFQGSMASITVLNSGTDVRSQLYNSGIPKQPWEYSQPIQDSYVLAVPLNTNIALGREFEDFSGNENNPTVVGGALINGSNLPHTNTNLVYNTFAFDGVNDSVSYAPDVVVGNNQSISIWFKSDNQSPMTYRNIFDMNHLVYGNGNVGPRLEQTSPTELYLAWASTASPNLNALLVGAIVTGKWYHFAMTMANGTVKVYLNGVETGSSGSTHGFASSFNNITFGQGFNSTRKFIGSQTQPMIFNRTLTPSEVSILYNGNLPKAYNQLPTSITNNCILAYEMTSNNNSLTDLSTNGRHGTANGGITSNGHEIDWDNTAGYESSSSNSSSSSISSDSSS